MTVISTGTYTDPAELARSVSALCKGLEAHHIIVALPQQDPKGAPSIEVRVASLWERFLSFIRFKPTAIRLATIQPFLSQFFKNNDQLLSSSPDLYPMLLKVYLHSICQREKTPPACLREKDLIHVQHLNLLQMTIFLLYLISSLEKSLEKKSQLPL